MKKMKAVIRKDGTLKVEVLGACGEDCVKFTERLEQRVGAPLGPRELKPEYHMTESEVEAEREVAR